MEEMGAAELVANISKYDLAQTLYMMPIFQAQSDAVAIDLQRARECIRGLEEHTQSCIEHYQRASYKRRQILEPSLRRGLRNGERVLMKFRKRQKDLKAEEMHCIAVDEMIRKRWKILLEEEAAEKNA
ncbi:uncharacterized protein EAF02_005061 [Botrytis sinoallii]|uniref:uncharacterized protein n=1 Tax=Botrytis sinoallii TaxID=1463999 RepID=UPI001901E083|nr:uncharacterized protein EAF02_005061 [Botrytis sinoallii]KAF7884725.1 hypothetical protein EAF02_005061 [Botrytis sinoallii]